MEIKGADALRGRGLLLCGHQGAPDLILIGGVLLQKMDRCATVVHDDHCVIDSVVQRSVNVQSGALLSDSTRLLQGCLC